MKKKIFLIILIIFITAFIIVKKTDKEDNTTLKVGEVTHSAFYAPFYVAINKGYFKDEGIIVDLSMISGANNVVSAVMSKDIDIGLCGPEATIYIYNSNKKDYIKSFAGLTKRDGQFLVGRKKENNFNWKKLKGKEVLAGRIGGMPELNFETALRNNNVHDVKINTSVDFSSLTSAFLSGEGDYVNLFEPNATKLEEMGKGYIVSSIGQKSNPVPYTAFNARVSFINKNPKLIKKFRKALNKGLKFTKEKDSKTITKVILKSFPDIKEESLIKIVNRYKKADTWLNDTTISRKLFENLEDIMIDAGQIKSRVPYNNLITNK